MVCPTCFCTTTEDVDRPDRRRTRSAGAAGPPASRSTSPTSTAAACGTRRRSRYRQWMTHKLATWHRPVRHLGLRRLRPLHHLVPGRHRHHRGGAGDPRTTRRAGGKGNADLDEIIGRAPFFAGLEPALWRADRRLRPQRALRCRTSISSARAAPADRFYLIRHGRVAFEITVPGRRPVRFLTLARARSRACRGSCRPTAGSYDAKARRADAGVALDAACLRGKCEADHHLGYEL